MAKDTDKPADPPPSDRKADVKLVSYDPGNGEGDTFTFVATPPPRQQGLVTAQCRPCPWRDMDTMRAEFPRAVAAAEAGSDGFMCHTRCIPCPGPALAGLTAARPLTDQETAHDDPPRPAAAAGGSRPAAP